MTCETEDKYHPTSSVNDMSIHCLHQVQSAQTVSIVKASLD